MQLKELSTEVKKKISHAALSVFEEMACDLIQVEQEISGKLTVSREIVIETVIDRFDSACRDRDLVKIVRSLDYDDAVTLMKDTFKSESYGV